jgi:soluble lytic murein transglycosylase
MKNLVIVFILFSLFAVAFANNVYGSPADYIKWHHDLYSKLPQMSQSRAKLLENSIYKASLVWGIDAEIIISVIQVETGFRNIIGSHGELGYMQVKFDTAEMLYKKYNKTFVENGFYLSKPKDLISNPGLDIFTGTAYLFYLYSLKGSMALAIKYYNASDGKNVYLERVFDVMYEIMRKVKI